MSKQELGPPLNDTQWKEEHRPVVIECQGCQDTHYTNLRSGQTFDCYCGTKIDATEFDPLRMVKVRRYGAATQRDHE